MHRAGAKGALELPARVHPGSGTPRGGLRAASFRVPAQVRHGQPSPAHMCCAPLPHLSLPSPLSAGPPSTRSAAQFLEGQRAGGAAVDDGVTGREAAAQEARRSSAAAAASSSVEAACETPPPLRLRPAMGAGADDEEDAPRLPRVQVTLMARYEMTVEGRPATVADLAEGIGWVCMGAHAAVSTRCYPLPLLRPRFATHGCVSEPTCCASCSRSDNAYSMVCCGRNIQRRLWSPRTASQRRLRALSTSTGRASATRWCRRAGAPHATTPPSSAAVSLVSCAGGVLPAFPGRLNAFRAAGRRRPLRVTVPCATAVGRAAMNRALVGGSTEPPEPTGGALH